MEHETTSDQDEKDAISNKDRLLDQVANTSDPLQHEANVKPLVQDLVLSVAGRKDRSCVATEAPLGSGQIPDAMEQDSENWADEYDSPMSPPCSETPSAPTDSLQEQRNIPL